MPPLPPEPSLPLVGRPVPPTTDAAVPSRGSGTAPAPAWLIDSAVHELKGPAAAMLELAALLADDPQEPPSPRQRRQLDHLMSAGRHLLGLLDDLRGADGGLWPCQAQSVDLQALAAEALAIHTAPAARRGLSLHLGGSAQPALAWADPRRTLQVLLNLVANAVRYSTPGTTVTVRVGPGACVSVQDQGPGLAEAELDRVFIPGERLGRADGQGQGLGLALSRALLRRMGGQLDFHSAAGQGSTVRVRLPAPRSTTAAAGTPVQPPCPPQAPVLTAELLCIDADPALARWLDARLSAPRRTPGMANTPCPAAWRVRQTARVTEAPALARASQPALVLLDPALPGGWEMLDSWQADPQLRRIPVVLVCGEVEPRAWLRARALGALDCWSRPLPLARLDALLAKLAGARHPSVPAPGPRRPMVATAPAPAHPG